MMNREELFHETMRRLEDLAAWLIDNIMPVTTSTPDSLTVLVNGLSVLYSIPSTSPELQSAYLSTIQFFIEAAMTEIGNSQNYFRFN